MAHLLSAASGKVEMFYVREAPWHGLGERLDDAPTSFKAMNRAGLGWRARVEPLRAEIEGDYPYLPPTFLEVPNHRAVVRSDTREVLGVVGRRYRPLQNAEAFDFLDSLVENKELTYETAGALGRGERVWMLARVPGDLAVKGSSDSLNKYLLLTNSHDGTGAARVFFTAVRVVCQNTLSLAERAAGRAGVAIRHTGDVPAKVDAARRVLGIASEHFDSIGRRIDLLATTPVKRPKLWRYFDGLFPDPIGGDGAELARLEERELSKGDPLSPSERRSLAAYRAHATRRRRGGDADAAGVRDRLVELFEHGAGNADPGVRGTWWAAYNAVTEYVDHTLAVKDDGRSDRDRRAGHLNSIWFGRGAEIKGKAWETALEAASV